MYTIELYRGVECVKGHSKVPWWTSSQNQLNYFANHLYQKIDNCTPQKDENVIYVGVNVDTMRTVPYACFYLNGGKRIYCFVDSVQYINENLTSVRYTIDSFQTYMFQLNTYACFVEREHQVNNVAYIPNIDEGFNVGSYVNSNFITLNKEFASDMIIVGSTKSMDDGKTDVTSGQYNGVYRGYKLYGFSGIGQLSIGMQRLLDNGNQDAIIEMYMTSSVLGATKSKSYEVENDATRYRNTYSISLPTTLDGYTPKNKKLLCYPFVVVEIANGTGESIQLQPELFSGTPTFEIYGVLNDGIQFVINPTNYNDSSNTKKLSINPYPKLSWANDPYATWLSQNNWSMATDLIAPVALGAITGGPAGAAVGGIIGALGTVATGLDLMNKPTNVGGAKNGTTVVRPSCVIRVKTITAIQARSIDEFLERYGERTNRFITPQFTGHSGHNYVKVTDCPFDGNIPADNLQEIRNAFESGVDLLHL